MHPLPQSSRVGKQSIQQKARFILQLLHSGFLPAYCCLLASSFLPPPPFWRPPAPLAAAAGVLPGSAR
jgi:hypothetical protein